MIKKVNDGYKRLIEGGEYKVISGEQEINEVFKEILSILDK